MLRAVATEETVKKSRADELRAEILDLTLEYAGVTVHVPPYQLSDVPTAFRVTVPYRALRPFAPDDGLIALAPQQ